MKKIKMLETANILTSVGPKEYIKNVTYTTEDWIANSFMGRNLAELVEEKKEKPLPDLENMLKKELVELAKERGVEYNGLLKEQLIQVLQGLQPPPEPFERLNG